MKQSNIGCYWDNNREHEDKPVHGMRYIKHFEFPDNSIYKWDTMGFSLCIIYTRTIISRKFISTAIFAAFVRGWRLFPSYSHIVYWLVVWNIFYFSVCWEESSQLTFILVRGLKPPTSVCSCKKCWFIIASVQSEAAGIHGLQRMGEIVGELAGGWRFPPRERHKWAE